MILSPVTSVTGVFLFTAITNYFYNAQGKRIRAESYLEGKEDSLGKTVEETVYDENGHAVKSFSYNSLDPSSKFYTESETDEDGKTVADIDATGKHKTAYTFFSQAKPPRTAACSRIATTKQAI